MADQLKRGIIALRKQGVSSAVLAKAFGLRRQQIAAWLAWETMKRKG